MCTQTPAAGQGQRAVLAPLGNSVTVTGGVPTATVTSLSPDAASATRPPRISAAARLTRPGLPRAASAASSSAA